MQVRILSPEKHVTSSITVRPGQRSAHSTLPLTQLPCASQVHDITEWESDKAFSRKATKGQRSQCLALPCTLPGA